MKKILLLSTILLVTITSVRAQITSTVSSQLHDPSFSMGRDFWFSFMSNEWGVDEGGKYMRIYITSDKNTTAYVSSGLTAPIPIVAGQVGSYICHPLWEMESSGIVESKAVHVWSKDADLVVCIMSRNSATADGECIIPTIGWGKDYVVAAYGQLIDYGEGNGFVDYPSTLAITADENNTIVTITPSCDCRQCYNGSNAGDTNSAVAFPSGQAFTDTLNRGQDVELMPVASHDTTSRDLTGTVIHATKPVGVEAGSMCPNIPSQFPYCDHVEDMVPPIRTWGETYYSIIFQPVVGTPVDHDSALYLFISTKPHQTIYRQECGNTPDTECVIASQYGVYWAEAAGPQKFFSDTAFLLVEYMNSTTYPDGANGTGDPAEAHINAREQFTKTVLFETPVNTGGQYPDPYYNYANITVNDSDAKRVRLDGKPISVPPHCLDSGWEIFVDTNLTAGAHIVTGDDSGVGVNVYGYGFDESYEWSSPSYAGTFHSADTLPPSATIATSCWQATVQFSDTSGLAKIQLDSIYNMAYIPDQNFIEGSGADTGSISMYVIDITKPALLQVSVFDFSGNRTTVTSMYKPNYDSVWPPLQNLGVWVDTPGSKPKIAFDTIFNLGQDTIYLDELRLQDTNTGFSIFDSIGGPIDLSPLAPKHRRRIQIQFLPTTTYKEVDSLVVGYACDSITVAVVGAGEFPDFRVFGATWPNEPLTDPASCYADSITLQNLSVIPLMIDSVWWADTIHFKAVTLLPITLPAFSGKAEFTIDYCPDSSSRTTVDRTEGVWFSHQVTESGTESPRFDSLIGWALGPLGVREEKIPSLNATVIPSDDGRSLEIILPTNAIAPANFEVVNVLGQSVLGATFGTQTEIIDASSLPRGVYFYRITLNGTSQMGKVILGQ